jgi:KipI family sensor histidine kinase inhibitor
VATWPRLAPLGDRGLLVEFAPEVSPEINALVRGADAVLERLPGVTETVPTFRSVLVVYDPLRIRCDDLTGQAEAAARAARPAPGNEGALVEIPVVYGGRDGPDLETVAQTLGLAPDEVVRLHCEPTYLVYMIGFSPGFAYLGRVPDALRLPRRTTPRTRVPAGSIAIADVFTGAYPQETPGGWHLLGRTWRQLFDPDRDEPALLRPGDRVRFVPVPAEARTVAATSRPRRTAPVARPVLEVLDGGLMTTVQDLGRRGWRRLGVPASGAMDTGALRAANAALGNPPIAAGLEFTFPGPRLRVVAETEIAVAGADLAAALNGAEIAHATAIRVRPGDRLSFERPRSGQWMYLSVAGGIDVPLVLGSRSTFARGGLGGIAGGPVRAGAVLGAGAASLGRRTSPAPGAGPRVASPSAAPFRVVLGPQAEAFTAEAHAALLGRPHEVTVQRDRSGVRLRGTPVAHRAAADILSDGVLPGAIQVPADGGPVVILADGPTTGGYAKIASVVSVDHDRLAQVRPGETIRFEAVTVARAHEWLRDHVGARTPT